MRIGGGLPTWTGSITIDAIGIANLVEQYAQRYVKVDHGFCESTRKEGWCVKTGLRTMNRGYILVYLWEENGDLIVAEEGSAALLAEDYPVWAQAAVNWAGATLNPDIGIIKRVKEAHSLARSIWDIAIAAAQISWGMTAKEGP